MRLLLWYGDNGNNSAEKSDRHKKTVNNIRYTLHHGEWGRSVSCLLPSCHVPVKIMIMSVVSYMSLSEGSHTCVSRFLLFNYYRIIFSWRKVHFLPVLKCPKRPSQRGKGSSKNHLVNMMIRPTFNIKLCEADQ